MRAWLSGNPTCRTAEKQCEHEIASNNLTVLRELFKDRQQDQCLCIPYMEVHKPFDVVLRFIDSPPPGSQCGTILGKSLFVSFQLMGADSLTEKVHPLCQDDRWLPPKRIFMGRCGCGTRLIGFPHDDAIDWIQIEFEYGLGCVLQRTGQLSHGTSSPWSQRSRSLTHIQR